MGQLACGSERRIMWHAATFCKKHIPEIPHYQNVFTLYTVVDMQKRDSERKIACKQRSTSQDGHIRSNIILNTCIVKFFSFSSSSIFAPLGWDSFDNMMCSLPWSIHWHSPCQSLSILCQLVSSMMGYWTPPPYKQLSGLWIRKKYYTEKKNFNPPPNILWNQKYTVNVGPSHLLKKCKPEWKTMDWIVATWKQSHVFLKSWHWASEKWTSNKIPQNKSVNM